MSASNTTADSICPPIFSDQRLRDLSRLSSERGRLDCILVGIYLESAQQRRLELHSAIEAGVSDPIAKIVHRWRGAAASIGLMALASMLENIENNPSSAEIRLSELTTIAQHSEALLSAYLKSAVDQVEMDGSGRLKRG